MRSFTTTRSVSCGAIVPCVVNIDVSKIIVKTFEELNTAVHTTAVCKLATQGIMCNTQPLYSCAVLCTTGHWSTIVFFVFLYLIPDHRTV